MNQLLKVELAVALLEIQKYSRVQSLLHQLKYKGQQEIGSFLGNWLVPQLKESNVFGGVDVVLPLPLYHTRLKQIGYNQVQLF